MEQAALQVSFVIPSVFDTPSSVCLSVCVQMNKQMYEERSKALQEIGQLSQAKQKAQQHMFLLSEAQQRLGQGEKTASSSSNNISGSSSGSSTVLQAQMALSPSLRVRRGPPALLVPSFTTDSQRSNAIEMKSGSFHGGRNTSTAAASAVLSASERHEDVELSEIQRDVERLKRQSAAILQSTAKINDL